MAFCEAEKSSRSIESELANEQRSVVSSFLRSGKIFAIHKRSLRLGRIFRKACYTMYREIPLHWETL
ncbi:hypothetical protein CH370_04040 [Leptospira kmetyi]|nr:hypothetical protein CH370_04040 [Leptospira kmetyi]